MPYPQLASIAVDFAQKEAAGLSIRGSDLAAVLSLLAEVLNQHREFIKAGFAADKTWRPAESQTQRLKGFSETTAIASQTSFPLPAGETANPVTDLAEVYVNGVLLPPSSVTLGASDVTIPARTAGDVVVVGLYNDSSSLATRLASQTALEGANLIGIHDTLNLYAAQNVEDALQEVRSIVFNIQTLLVDYSLLIRADGSVPFGAPQSMGNNRLTLVANGVDDQDAVNVSQLNVLIDLFGDLDTKYLKITGGVLSGVLNMGNNRIINLSDAVNATDAANLGQVNTRVQAVSDLVAGKVSLAGTADTVGNGTLTGPLTLGASAAVTADADQTTDPGAVTTHTLHGVPTPAADDHVANKSYVDSAVSGASIIDGLVARFFTGYTFPGTGKVTDPDLTTPGYHIYDEVEITTPNLPIASHAILVVQGALTFTGSGSLSVGLAPPSDEWPYFNSKSLITRQGRRGTGNGGGGSGSGAGSVGAGGGAIGGLATPHDGVLGLRKLGFWLGGDCFPSATTIDHVISHEGRYRYFDTSGFSEVASDDGTLMSPGAGSCIIIAGSVVGRVINTSTEEGLIHSNGVGVASFPSSASGGGGIFVYARTSVSNLYIACRGGPSDSTIDNYAGGGGLAVVSAPIRDNVQFNVDPGGIDSVLWDVVASLSGSPAPSAGAAYQGGEDIIRNIVTGGY